MNREKETSICQNLHLCLKLVLRLVGLNENGIQFLIRKLDPDASETMSQFSISKSLQGTHVQKKVNWKMRLLTENGLLEGARKYAKIFLIRLYRHTMDLINMKALTSAEFNCIIDTYDPGIRQLSEFHLIEMKKFILVISILLLCAFISLVLEILFSKLHQITNFILQS